MLVTSHKIGEMYLRLLGTNDFPVKAENGKFAAAEISFAWLCQKGRTKKRATRAAQLFFPVLPIISLICGVVVS